VSGQVTPEERKQVDAIPKFQADLLGEAEHDGWVDWLLGNGWSLAEKRDDPRQLNNLLVPYRDLPDKEKAKDCDAIAHYPDIAQLAGLKIELGVQESSSTP